MSRGWGSVLVGSVLLATALGACRNYLPTGQYLQKRAAPERTTRDARGKFDHARHAPVFDQRDVTCLDCHRFDALLAQADDERARDLSALAMRPGSSPCHHCHQAGPTHVVGAPTECTTCHENLLALRPTDHEMAWRQLHGEAAQVDPARCANCHQQSQCVDCHQARDSIRTHVHVRNFRFLHGIEARANPSQCGTCHRQETCIRCHQQAGLE